MTDIYERIIEQSTKLGLTGKELGALLGLKKSPLTDWKNKKSCPTLEQVSLLCEIFAVSADYLIFGQSTLKSDEQEFLQNYMKLDSRGRHRVHTTIYDELDRMKLETSTEEKIG